MIDEIEPRPDSLDGDESTGEEPKQEGPHDAENQGAYDPRDGRRAPLSVVCSRHTDGRWMRPGVVDELPRLGLRVDLKLAVSLLRLIRGVPVGFLTAPLLTLVGQSRGFFGLLRQCALSVTSIPNEAS